MTIDPDKFSKYLAHREQYPDFCLREWPCQEQIDNGELCYQVLPFKEIVDQLDSKTKAKIGAPQNLDCPQSYVDLLNRCLYGRLSERGGCPKNLYTRKSATGDVG